MQSIKEIFSQPVPHQVVRTSGGFAEQDQSGLWHFNNQRPGNVRRAIEDVLHHTDLRPAWFWFNGTPCPVIEGDDVESIENRWLEWKGPLETLGMILKTEASPLALLKKMAQSKL